MLICHFCACMSVWSRLYMSTVVRKNCIYVHVCSLTIKPRYCQKSFENKTAESFVFTCLCCNKFKNISFLWILIPHPPLFQTNMPKQISVWAEFNVFTRVFPDYIYACTFWSHQHILLLLPFISRLHEQLSLRSRLHNCVYIISYSTVVRHNFAAVTHSHGILQTGRLTGSCSDTISRES